MKLLEQLRPKCYRKESFFVKTRILKTRLADPLNGHLKHCSKAALADRIGVSPQKLNAMVNDQWDYITRDAIERAADFLKLDVVEIFELVTVDFWKHIEDANRLLLLGRSDKASDEDPHYPMPRYDDEATYIIKNFMRKNLPTCNELHVIGQTLDDDEIAKRAENQNCIVIGGPKTNRATEIVLSRFFGAKEFDPSPENRRKIPFGFCWPPNEYFPRESSLTCSDAARSVAEDTPGISVKTSGISVKNGPYVAAHHHPPKEFHKLKTDDGLDCGLVFVANRSLTNGPIVKLIVLSGFGGMGTLAATKALIQDFRYLEPSQNETFVFGIVEGKYRKSADSDVSELKSVRWKYRKGGHSPLK